MRMRKNSVRMRKSKRADEEKQLKIEAEERANALEEEVQRLRKLLKSQEQK